MVFSHAQDTFKWGIGHHIGKVTFCGGIGRKIAFGSSGSYPHFNNISGNLQYIIYVKI